MKIKQREKSTEKVSLKTPLVIEEKYLLGIDISSEKEIEKKSKEEITVFSEKVLTEHHVEEEVVQQV